jgi:hypothetical protein
MKRYDLTDKKFGSWLVTAKSSQKTKAGRTLWKCVCDCGKKSQVSTSCLVRGHSKSCGKCTQLKAGQIYGKLTIIRKSNHSLKVACGLWLCKCECGNRVHVRGSNLKDGNSKSCGCNVHLAVAAAKKQKIIDACGTYISSKDPWYRRAAGVWVRIKEEKQKTNFSGIPELGAYLKSIAPQKCPVFGVKLVTGKNHMHKWSPSADRIDPKKGYVRGNIQIISMFANTMKQDANSKQLKQFAEWVLQ